MARPSDSSGHTSCRCTPVEAWPFFTNPVSPRSEHRRRCRVFDGVGVYVVTGRIGVPAGVAQQALHRPGTARGMSGRRLNQESARWRTLLGQGLAPGESGTQADDGAWNQTRYEAARHGEVETVSDVP